MYVQLAVRGGSARRAFWLGITIFTTLTSLPAGCGTSLMPQSPDEHRTTLDVASLGLDSASTYFETYPNHLFEIAEQVEVDDQSRVIRGRISGPNDVDVYDLGPVSVGDHIVVDMTTVATLNGAIALFNETGVELLVNDHRNVYMARTAPFVDVVIRRPGQACYVAVTVTPGYDGVGDYALIASKESAVALPPVRPDVVLLDFDGGDRVQIGSRTPVRVPAFDPERISTRFSGRSLEMIDAIVAAVREDFAGLDVTVVSTSDGHFYETGMTRIYFGTYDDALLGVAEGVDEFNSTKSQVAIVFTDTFAVFDRLKPSVEQMAQAIANVASHEIGHLLGMIHTADPNGLMDVTASLRELLEDQAFTVSSIYTAVFPIGLQDAPRYLLDTIGGDAAVVFSKANRKREEARMRSIYDPDPFPARASFRLSSCALDESAHYSVFRDCVAEPRLHPPLIRGERGGSRDTQ